MRAGRPEQFANPARVLFSLATPLERPALGAVRACRSMRDRNTPAGTPALAGKRSLGFTLIELILVMAILTVAVSLTAPALANFFHGRSLDSEARRLLSLTRQGQSRAASEGLPVELWVDTAQRTYGLEIEPSYEKQDAKAESFFVDKDVELEVVNLGAAPVARTGSENGTPVVEASNHPNLPRIRFLPDGTVSESSPQMLRLVGRDGVTLWIALARSRLNYEIRTQANP
ncbi:MAG TPA: prepilin-type N-terminal cleavage/methylation domain-containing protein [Candidatus Dormibacteraeota bacterium]|nr:prepilin-type N-terminal cleavage/methylation domain-containing protein [Candidatus Dormibacteraeota bacterium]